MCNKRICFVVNIIMTKVTIQFISDIHLEFYKKELDISEFIHPCADYLAILGDLGYPESEIFKTFLAQVSKQYKKVFYVSGNHEFYTCNNPSVPTMDELNNKMKRVCNRFDNVHYLNNEEYILSDTIVLLGTTLWTNIPKSEGRRIKHAINDYKYIFVKENHYKTNVSPETITTLHHQSVEWLSKKCTNHQDKTIIVLSHHLPTFHLISPAYRYYSNNTAFASNLDYLMQKHDHINYWLCGHTHSSMQCIIHNCHCMTNPHGYPGENSNYDKRKIICVGN